MLILLLTHLDDGDDGDGDDHSDGGDDDSDGDGDDGGDDGSDGDDGDDGGGNDGDGDAVMGMMMMVVATIETVMRVMNQLKIIKFPPSLSLSFSLSLFVSESLQSSRDCWISRIHLCRRVRPHHPKEWPGLDSKQSDGGTTVLTVESSDSIYLSIYLSIAVCSYLSIHLFESAHINLSWGQYDSVMTNELKCDVLSEFELLSRSLSNYCPWERH